MRAPDRIRPLLDELATIWERHPDLRLGQLLVAANGNQDPFHVGDADLMAKVRGQFAPMERVPDCTCGHAKSIHVGLDNAYACSWPGGCMCAHYRSADVAIASVPLAADRADDHIPRNRLRAALVQAISDMPAEALSSQIADAILARFEVRLRR